MINSDNNTDIEISSLPVSIDYLNYINNSIPNIKKNVIKYIMEDIKPANNENDYWLEFGVYKGDSITYISQFNTNKLTAIYGFDSFEGLPEIWRGGYGPEVFNLNGNIPEVPNNVKLIKGWFSDTLPLFVEKHFSLDKNNEKYKNKITFINIDSDIYSSAKCILETLKYYIANGCIINFDEMVNYDGYSNENGELRAWYKFINENNVDYDWIGMNGTVGTYKSDMEAVALRINSISL